MKFPVTVGDEFSNNKVFFFFFLSQLYFLKLSFKRPESKFDFFHMQKEKKKNNTEGFVS